MFSALLVSLALLAQTVSADSHWGGGVVRVAPGTLQSVSGSFLVPQVSPPPYSWVDGTEYAASTWVGIDGFSLTPNGPSCPNMLQAGISMRVTPSASGTTYHCCPWYEWLPGPETLFDSTCTWCQPGDSISVTVVATSTTTGNATIVNRSSKKSFTTSLSSPSAPLCLQFADYVVEQIPEHIAAYDPITIIPTATLRSGATVLPTASVYTENIVISSTTYATGFAAATAVVVADEPGWGPA